MSAISLGLLRARRHLFPAGLKIWLGLALAACVLAPVLAQTADPDDQFLNIYGMIQEADTLSNSGKPEAAQAKYRQAQTALEQFRRKYPSWNPRLINFRMQYLEQKLSGFVAKPAKPTNALGGPVQSDAGPGTAAPSSGAQVKLLEAGAEPRQPLRLHPKAGDRQSVAMTFQIAMGMKTAQGANPPTRMPPIKMALEMEVKDVGADITYEMNLKEVTVADQPGAQPELVAAMRAAVAGLKGVAGTITMSDRGVPKSARISGAAAKNPQADQMVDQLEQAFSLVRVLLPEEAVGAGARWEARLPVKTQGMTIDQTATYEVASLEGDRLTTRATLTQKAANQKIQSPAMPALKLDLTQMTGRGSGTVTSDLGQPVPREGKMDYHSDAAMALNTGGQKQTMSASSDVTVVLEGK